MIWGNHFWKKKKAFKANTLCSEENVLFYRCLLIHLLFAWKSSLKGQNPCLFKSPRGNLACLFIRTNIVRLESKSITLVCLERKDNVLNFWSFKETVPLTLTFWSLEFLWIYFRLFTSVNNIMTHYSAHFLLFLQIRITGWGSIHILLILKYRTYVHANQKPLVLSQIWQGKWKKKMVLLSGTWLFKCVFKS